MCGNYDNLKDEILALDRAGVEMFHIDLMDGNFVPNFAMGRQDIHTIRKHTDKLIDVHLMVSSPKNYLPILVEEKVDIVYIHPESDNRIIESFAYLRNQGIAPGIAVSPHVSYLCVQEILPYVEYVLLMTVVPGFAGQAFLQQTLSKIDQFIENKPKHAYQLILDGAVSPQVIAKFSKMGVDGFVLGSSSLFYGDQNYAEIVRNLRESDTESES